MALIGLEKLSRCLTVIVALAFVSGFQSRVTDQAYVKFAFFFRSICDFAEGVERHDGFLITLLAAKDKVDPSVQVVGHILRFNAFTHYLHKLECILVSPCWQNNIVDACAILLQTKIALVVVDE